MKKRALAPVITAAAVLVAATPAGAAVRSCHTSPNFGDNGPGENIGALSVRNMLCSTAQWAISGGEILPNGGFVPRGFWDRCYTLKVWRQDGQVLGAIDRCTLGNVAFRFTWAT